MCPNRKTPLLKKRLVYFIYSVLFTKLQFDVDIVTTGNKFSETFFFCSKYSNFFNIFRDYFQKNCVLERFLKIVQKVGQTLESVLQKKIVSENFSSVHMVWKSYDVLSEKIKGGEWNFATFLHENAIIYYIRICSRLVKLVLFLFL